jgi:mannose-6-phosphate isomerase-like protein (cupin superfamily)
MEFKPKKYREVLMEGRTDDGTFGRGPFDRWIPGEQLHYGINYLVHPEDAISLRPRTGHPRVFEEYGIMTTSFQLNGALTLCGGVATIPPDHPPMRFRRQNCEEALYVIRGEGRVEVEDESESFQTDHAVFLPVWTRHRIANTGSDPLQVFWVKGIEFRAHESLGHLVSDQGELEPAGESPSRGYLKIRGPVQYWRKLVVRTEDRIPHFSAKGEIAKSPGQQGYNYITPANVGAITVRLVGGLGPAAILDRVKDPLKEFTMTWHNTEEIHYYIEGEGLFVVDDYHMHFKKGDTILTPARSKHQGYPKDKTYREMCATGIRFRPFEGLTESAIDQREYMEE